MCKSNVGRYIDVDDGKKIFLYSWENVQYIKGVVQIFHGMAEHAGRYDEISKILNSKGYVVFADDHRGHGLTAAGLTELGFIGEDGFNRIVQDEYFIMNMIKEKYPEKPVFILGHSFGSFLAQEFYLRYGNEIQGLMLSGTSAAKGIEVIGGKILSKYEMNKYGESSISERIDRLSFGGYNKRIIGANSKFSWLSRDEKEVEKYEDDEYCGSIFTVGFFYYLFRGFSKFYSKGRMKLINREVPIYIAAGKEDPVGKYGKSVQALFSIYSRYGVKDIKIKLYDGARHEIFKEINKKEVFDDLVEWIEGVKN